MAGRGRLLALPLEGFLLLIALAGMAAIYFREASLQAKYGFFSLAALSLMGMVTPVLDQAPLNVAYWGLWVMAGPSPPSPCPAG